MSSSGMAFGRSHRGNSSRVAFSRRALPCSAIEATSAMTSAAVGAVTASRKRSATKATITSAPSLSLMLANVSRLKDSISASDHLRSRDVTPVARIEAVSCFSHHPIHSHWHLLIAGERFRRACKRYGEVQAFTDRFPVYRHAVVFNHDPVAGNAGNYFDELRTVPIRRR